CNDSDRWVDDGHPRGCRLRDGRSGDIQTPRLRVLLVHTSYRQAGGEDSVVRNQSKLLEMAGHTVATHILENPTTAREAAVDVMRAPWNPTAAESVVRASEDFGADVVHVHNT